MPLTQNSLNNGARWQVCWQGKHGNIIRKEYEEDFGGALDAYTTLKAAGKKLVTLRCCNVGFPPPEYITKHEVTRYRVVTRRRGGKLKKFKQKYTDHINLMSEYNARGIYWCAYCIKLRHFVLSPDKSVMQCPLCGITMRDFHVRMHNPKAVLILYRRRSTRGSRRVRRRSR